MKNEENLGKIMASAFATYARNDALDYRVIEQPQDAFEIDVTGCRYAKFYKELVNRSSDSCWPAVRTSTRPRDLVST